MYKKGQIHKSKWEGPGSCFAVIGIACIVSSASASWGRTRADDVTHDEAMLRLGSVELTTSSDTKTGQAQTTIPTGTILPVRLRTTINPEKLRPGQTIRGEIAQEVPLPNGAKIPKRSRVEGHVMEVAPANNGAKASTSIRFDKLYLHGAAIPIITDLRAIAGFMDVEEAGVPDQAPGGGNDANWLDRRQIGGDSVYGVGGQVRSAEDSSQVVGKAVDDGVLVRVRGKEGTKCRGAIDGNDAPQALWVFSSDACGVYGLPDVNIVYAGRTEPLGTIVLEMQGSRTKIRSAAGMLLRVIG